MWNVSASAYCLWPGLIVRSMQSRSLAGWREVSSSLLFFQGSPITAPWPDAAGQYSRRGMNMHEQVLPHSQNIRRFRFSKNNFDKIYIKNINI